MHVRSVLVAAAIAIVAAGLWLLGDASTYALHAARPGKPSGCYTKVDDWLGAKRPSTWRSSEALGGLGVLGTSAGLFVLSLRRRIRSLGSG